MRASKKWAASQDAVFAALNPEFKQLQLPKEKRTPNKSAIPYQKLQRRIRNLPTGDLINIIKFASSVLSERPQLVTSGYLETNAEIDSQLAERLAREA